MTLKQLFFHQPSMISPSLTKRPGVILQFLAFLLSFVFWGLEGSCTEDLKISPNNAGSEVAIRQPAGIVSPPRLNKGQYAVFLNDSYVVFATIKVDGVEYSSNCRKNKKFDCTAINATKHVDLNQQIKLPFFTNLGAVYCSAIGGKNLIALDYRQNERDFCKFADGSMASSWSLYWQNEETKSAR